MQPSNQYDRIFIIGSGIFGLSLAEAFSRSHPKSITVIDHNHPLAGSPAAAANLFTKGQAYARDSHFQIKLHAKKNYHIWLNNLLKETNSQHSISDLYLSQPGFDHFKNSHDRDEHFKRVFQEDVKEDNYIEKSGESSIQYAHEAWVDARGLLALLKSVCLKRGVMFIEEKLHHELLHHMSSSPNSLLIFCLGAFTESVFSEFGISVHKDLFQKKRLTIGSTLCLTSPASLAQTAFSHYPILSEFFSEGLKKKVSLSGSTSSYFLSSSSLKLEEIPASLDDFKMRDTLTIENNTLLSLFMSYFPEYQNNHSLSVKKSLTGLRVGYGHKELLIAHASFQNTRALVCTGAHRSGYLFAPCLGDQVQLFLHQHSQKLEL